MKIFLTGATGFIGQPLTKSLLRRGWNVTALVRQPQSPPAQAICKMGARLAIGDITQVESMRAAMHGADIVIHNAGQYELGMSRAGKLGMHAVNVEGTENVLSLAHELGIPRSVYVSTVQAFGETGLQSRDETYSRHFPCRTTYEQTKTDAHTIALQYQQRGLPLIIVCPHQVIGANDHSAFGYFLRLYVNRVMPPVCWSPKSIFCCVEVNELAQGIALAAEKGRLGETYLLSGEPKTLYEHIDFWKEKPGAIFPRVWLPAWLTAALFAPLEPFQRMVGLPAFLSRETVRAASINWNYSNAKARRELGWTHCSAEKMWLAALDGEIQLLSRRKGQKLVQRLNPLETVE